MDKPECFGGWASLMIILVYVAKLALLMPALVPLALANLSAKSINDLEVSITMRFSKLDAFS